MMISSALYKLIGVACIFVGFFVNNLVLEELISRNKHFVFNSTFVGCGIVCMISAFVIVIEKYRQFGTTNPNDDTEWARLFIRKCADKFFSTTSLVLFCSSVANNLSFVIDGSTLFVLILRNLTAPLAMLIGHLRFEKKYAIRKWIGIAIVCTGVCYCAFLEHHRRSCMCQEEEKTLAHLFHNKNPRCEYLSIGVTTHSFLPNHPQEISICYKSKLGGSTELANQLYNNISLPPYQANVVTIKLISVIVLTLISICIPTYITYSYDENRKLSQLSRRSTNEAAAAADWEYNNDSIMERIFWNVFPLFLLYSIIIIYYTTPNYESSTFSINTTGVTVDMSKLQGESIFSLSLPPTRSQLYVLNGLTYMIGIYGFYVTNEVMGQAEANFFMTIRKFANMILSAILLYLSGLTPDIRQYALGIALVIIGSLIFM